MSGSGNRRGRFRLNLLVLRSSLIAACDITESPAMFNQRGFFYIDSLGCLIDVAIVKDIYRFGIALLGGKVIYTESAYIQ